MSRVQFFDLVAGDHFHVDGHSRIRVQRVAAVLNEESGVPERRVFCQTRMGFAFYLTPNEADLCHREVDGVS